LGKTGAEGTGGIQGNLIVGGIKFLQFHEFLVFPDLRGEER
jgi:hypothetical protein